MQKCKKQENILYLPLKKKWFEMIKSGIKKEEYREISMYYAARFLEKEYYEKLKEKLTENGKNDVVVSLLDIESESCGVVFRRYDKIVLTLGYPKADDKERHIEFDDPVITIGKGKPEWGAVEGKCYFVIKLQ